MQNRIDPESPRTFPGLDLSRLLADPDPARAHARRPVQARNDPPSGDSLDDWLLREAVEAVAAGAPVILEHTIRNTDRAVGARLAGEIARRWGDAGLPPRTIVVKLDGSAGQSLGAFCLDGLRLEVWGEANDYVGKGMAGGEIVIRPPLAARWTTNENFIAGNTVLYGATGGALYAAGRAGERFAVRNSGASAVVEGVGDHGCEYMTGGVVVVLGTAGRNFGAGMTGGIAYVFDAGNTLPLHLNDELVRLERIAGNEDEPRLRGLMEAHAEATGSAWALSLLGNWQMCLPSFWKVSPR